MKVWVGCPQTSTGGGLVICSSAFYIRTCPVLQLLEDAKHRQAHLHWQNKVAAWQSVLADMFPAMAVSELSPLPGSWKISARLLHVPLQAQPLLPDPLHMYDVQAAPVLLRVQPGAPSQATCTPPTMFLCRASKWPTSWTAGRTGLSC